MKRYRVNMFVNGIFSADVDAEDEEDAKMEMLNTVDMNDIDMSSTYEVECLDDDEDEEEDDETA